MKIQIKYTQKNIKMRMKSRKLNFKNNQIHSSKSEKAYKLHKIKRLFKHTESIAD